MATYQEGDIVSNKAGDRLQLKGNIWVPIEPKSSMTEQEVIPGIPETAMPTVGADRDTGAFRAALRAAGTQFAGNLAEMPNLALTAGMNAASTLLSPGQKMPIPDIGDQIIPTPSGEQVMAGLETATELPGALLSDSGVDLSQMFGTNLADAEALAAEHPTATSIGTLLGDGATIATGRAPLAKAKAPLLIAKRKAAVAQAQNSLSKIPASVKSELDDVISDKIIPALKSTGKLLGRAGAKAVGTGVEGATLALLNEGDPENMFWYGAGGQAIGSASLHLAVKPVKRLLPFVATAWVASEMFKAAAPGDQDFFGSKDFAINKAMWAMGLG
ncbi:MAG: hypothetical protein ACPGSI_18770, partial [Pikeienuella sp.]